MTIVRQSPSGPNFALIGNTNEVENESVVPSAPTASDALDELDTRLADIEVIEIVEFFQGGANVEASASDIGHFGENGWSFFRSGNFGLGRLNGAVNRYGQYGVSTQSANQSGLILGSSTTPSAGFSFLATQIERVEWVGATNTTAGLNGKYRFGLGTSPTAQNFGANGIYLEVDREITTSWRCVCRRGGVNTVVTTSVASTPNGTFFKLAFERETTGAFRFEINDVVVGTISTLSAIPTALLTAGCQVEATINSGQDMTVDTFRMRYRRAA